MSSVDRIEAASIQIRELVRTSRPLVSITNYHNFVVLLILKGGYHGRN